MSRGRWAKGVQRTSTTADLGSEVGFASVAGAPPRRLDRTPLCPTTYTFGEGGGEGGVSAKGRRWCDQPVYVSFRVDRGRRAIAIARNRACHRTTETSKTIWGSTRGGARTSRKKRMVTEPTGSTEEPPFDIFPRDPLIYSRPVFVRQTVVKARSTVGIKVTLPRCVRTAPHDQERASHGECVKHSARQGKPQG